MAYIVRDRESTFLASTKEYSCILVTGMQQVGKSTMLMYLDDQGRNILNLHDLAKDVGVSDDTAKRWIGVLGGSGIFFLRPVCQ
jgi:hypothetical protein